MQSPVHIITIEREYGSRGGEFAHDLAERLGWKLLDSELVEDAARAAGVSPELASRFDERLDPWYYRYGKIFWHDAAFPMAGLSDEQVFDSERMFELIRSEILKAAESGNCVLVGRGAACALACHPGCFHVFVYATARAMRFHALAAVLADPLHRLAATGASPLVLGQVHQYFLPRQVVGQPAPAVAVAAAPARRPVPRTGGLGRDPRRIARCGGRSKTASTTPALP